MNEQLRIGVLLRAVREFLTVDVGVDMALTSPYLDVVAAGLTADVCAEELIRVEQDLLVFRDGLDHVDGVGGSTADVGQSLYVCRGVDVADHDGVGEFFLPLLELLSGDGIRE